VTWLKAARAPFLTVSAIPAVLGGVIAWANGHSDWLLFVLAVTGVVMAQSAADFFDDYFDYHDGSVANKDRQFHDSPLFAGRVTAKQVAVAGILCALIAAAIGAYLYARVGTPVLILALVGGFFVFFYTAPPFRLNFRGFGELALFLGFGPALVLGVYYVLSGEIGWEPVVAGIPLGIFTMNVGHVSNMFDVASDRDSGKTTLAVLVGQETGLALLAMFSALGYGVIIGGVVLDLLPAIALLALVTVPLAIQTVLKTKVYTEPEGYLPAMSWAIATTSFVGILVIVAYLL
jgi:1,4-dihydroxy-2-naphthoate octaprenyltransferase